ncbi:MAG: serine hydrolase domain-containing protein [Thermomicrobiales bacterium]
MTADGRWQVVLESAAEAQRRFHVPGLSIAILADGETRSGGLGVTDLRAPLDVDGDTLFQIGSISKTFTAVMTLLLHQRGLLDLDAPLRRYLPDFTVADRDASERVTPRLLFSHTAGWLGDFFDNDTASLALATDRMRWLPQLYPLGTLWSYNNAAFFPAGLLVERLTGRSFARVVQEELFSPLGMTNSGYRLTDLLTAKVAMGFSAVFAEGGTPQPGRWYGEGSIYPVGGISSTANDILRWARFIIDGRDDHGNEVLDAASRATCGALRYPAGLDRYTGFTWFTREIDGVRLLSHGGSMRFQQSELIIAPDREFAMVILTNSERGSELYGEVTAVALREYLGASAPKPEAVAGTPEQLAPYAGRYRSELADFELTRAGDTLWLHMTQKSLGTSIAEAEVRPPVRLALTATPDVLLARDAPFAGEAVEFLRGDGGEIAWMRIGHRLRRRV